MTASELEELAPLIQDLFHRLIVEGVPERVSYRGWLSADRPFALDEQGYKIAYAGVLRWVFSIARLAKVWSEEGVSERLHHLLLRLAAIRYASEPPPDFRAVARDWLVDIDVAFSEQRCHVPVIGLAPSIELRVGTIVFTPVRDARTSLDRKVHDSFFSGLEDHRDCISSGTFSAEPRRATEMLRADTETALNLLRYIGLLVWYNQPARHMYVSGQQRERVSYAVAIDPSGPVTEIGTTDSTPVPYVADQQFLMYAQFHGLDFFSSLLSSPSRSELEETILLAANWCGDSAQELSPLTAFLKAFVSIEACTKLSDENAGSVLPERISVLLEPYSKARQAALQSEISELVRERNAVVHGGKPARLSPETLAWRAKRVSLGTINQLRQRMSSEHLTTKAELRSWVRAHKRRWLR